MNSIPFRGRMKELNKEAKENMQRKLNHQKDRYREEEEERVWVGFKKQKR